MFVIFCSILSMLENKFAVGTTVPKTQHRTLVDVYVDVSYFCVLFSAWSAFITRYVDEEEGITVAWEVNWILFGINAGIMLLCIIYIFYAESLVEEGIKDWLEYASAKRSPDSPSSPYLEQKGTSTKSPRRRAGSIMDVGGGRKAGVTTSVRQQLHRAQISRAVLDAKVTSSLMYLLYEWYCLY